ncbi:hypothetical protein VP1G_11410 [Cytospora mali]|uniref:Uncharacterized protein n=1 Tax=Cytospora mali TaxID=578113 RepID=A0A194VF17_CYTMA|nr:hypothetical protein VP1G_11410 [Valsa mali var. pyri (nom. inval.)]
MRRPAVPNCYIAELRPTQHIQINRDLIQQQHRPRPDKPHSQLHAAPLAIADSAHAPAGIDVQHVDQLVPAVRVGVAADGAQQLHDADVRPHDGVEHPLEAEVRDALEAVLERVRARDGDGARGRQPLACQEAQERGLARAVGADEEGPRLGREGEADVVDA